MKKKLRYFVCLRKEKKKEVKNEKKLLMWIEENKAEKKKFMYRIVHNIVLCDKKDSNCITWPANICLSSY